MSKSTSAKAPARPDERRTTYRVLPDQDNRIAITYRTPQGDTLNGEVVDISADGARARFTDAPPLANGSHATLMLHAPHLCEPVELQAVVASTVGSEPQPLYGFRFSPGDPLRGRMSQDLYRLFNRRAGYRGVTPDPAERIEVVIYLPGESGTSALGTARLRNISVSGIGIFVDPDLDARMIAVSQIEISLRLPPDSRLLRLPTSVCYRSARDGYVCYGLRLDSSRSENILGQAEDIAEYMIRRMEAELLEDTQR